MRKSHVYINPIFESNEFLQYYTRVQCHNNNIILCLLRNNIITRRN